MRKYDVKSVSKLVEESKEIIEKSKEVREKVDSLLNGSSSFSETMSRLNEKFDAQMKKIEKDFEERKEKFEKNWEERRVEREKKFNNQINKLEEMQDKLFSGEEYSMEELIMDLGKEVVRDPTDSLYSKKNEELFKELGEKLGVDTDKFFPESKKKENLFMEISSEDMEAIKSKIRKLH